MSDLKSTLQERGNQYGDFAYMSELAQRIKRIFMENGPMDNDVYSECLEMIATKLARIVAGNPEKADTWHDIAGYATLAEQACPDYSPAETVPGMVDWQNSQFTEQTKSGGGESYFMFATEARDVVKVPLKQLMEKMHQLGICEHAAAVDWSRCQASKIQNKLDAQLVLTDALGGHMAFRLNDLCNFLLRKGVVRKFNFESGDQHSGSIEKADFWYSVADDAIETANKIQDFYMAQVDMACGKPPCNIPEWVRQLFKSAAERFGETNILVKAAEELAEAGKECCKTAIGEGDRNALNEEIADALVMIDQLIHDGHIDLSEVKRIKQLKLERIAMKLGIDPGKKYAAESENGPVWKWRKARTPLNLQVTPGAVDKTEDYLRANAPAWVHIVHLYENGEMEMFHKQSDMIKYSGPVEGRIVATLQKV